MMSMLSDGSSLPHNHPGALYHHVAAVRQAMGTLQGPGRLPPHLLFSDRDFDENDYEALLALDDSIASRKGALLFPDNVNGPNVVRSCSSVHWTLWTHD